MNPPVVGIVGGGQLARMLAEAASPLGVGLRVLAGGSDEGAPEVVVDVVRGAPDDHEALIEFARTVDVITFDHENVSLDALAKIEADGIAAVRPNVATLGLADKAHQRRTFSAAGFPVPPFEVIDVPDDVDRTPAIAAALEFLEVNGGGEGQIIAKASRGGYDGRGVWKLGREDIPGFLADYHGAPLVLEPLLQLDLEIAVLVARNPSGEIAIWPVVETVQVDGMCDEVLLTAPIDRDLASQAIQIGHSIAESVGSVGVFAVELFVSDGELLINEVAPRVHNSGHLTIEGCVTSQFEQHLRAVLDWPLGPTDQLAPSVVMRNVVGGADDPRCNQAAMFAEVPQGHLHLYGKSPRPDRKLGHVTVLGADMESCRSQASRAVSLVEGTVGAV
ncbi:MAG: 5-(carboxyamino)imidazole ribonucleotide synthase [Microthrixaceae bacterium]